jgi:transcriptional regulator
LFFFCSLVIFSEPHAYISPSNDDKEQNVQLWNYLTVHCYGKGKLITETEKVLKLLENTIDNYEESYRQQWGSFSQTNKTRMMNGIVGFEILVTDFQGKKKLSQGKNQNEQSKIGVTISKSNDSTEKAIAD